MYIEIQFQLLKVRTKPSIGSKSKGKPVGLFLRLFISILIIGALKRTPDHLTVRHRAKEIKLKFAHLQKTNSIWSTEQYLDLG